MLKVQDDYTTLIATFEDFILLVYTIIDDLCSRTRFNRTRRSLLQVTELIRQKLPFVFPILGSRYFVIDRFPLPVCKFGRARFSRSFRADGANYGRCPSKKETYFGFKAHALITLEGYITAFEITPASVDDREGLRDFAEKRMGLVILGDKGYTGEALFEDMRANGICLMSLKPSNYKTNWPKELRRLIFRFRRRVETVFSQLSEQMNAERVLAKSFRELCTRLENKILGHNLCMAFNSIFREPCDIGKIKQLIF